MRPASTHRLGKARTLSIFGLLLLVFVVQPVAVSLHFHGAGHALMGGEMVHIHGDHHGLPAASSVVLGEQTPGVSSPRCPTQSGQPEVCQSQFWFLKQPKAIGTQGTPSLEKPNPSQAPRLSELQYRRPQSTVWLDAPKTSPPLSSL